MLGFLLWGFVMVPCLKASFAQLNKRDNLFYFLTTTPYVELHQILHILFFHMVLILLYHKTQLPYTHTTFLHKFIHFLYRLYSCYWCKCYYPCHCITMWNIVVSVGLAFFHIASYNISMEGYVPCGLGFPLWVIHCSSIFVSWLQVIGSNSLCFALCWYGLEPMSFTSYNKFFA